ncbi:MAG: Ig-like domain-containing protein [Acidobacteriota bacterium]|nr:Ig-like domain-containing protein [Acidobacteriota bacterium]
MTDSSSGLVWMEDGSYVVTSGLSHSVVLSRVQALRVLQELNSGAVDNLGFSDWRLPTRNEVDRLFLREGEALAGMLGTDPIALLEALISPAERSRGGAGTADERVLVWPVRGEAIEAGFDQVVIFATNSVRIKNRGAVLSGEVVVNDASAGPTLMDNYELGMDPRSAVVGDVTADSVWLKNRSTVGGDVSYNDLRNQGTVGGSLVTPLSLPVFSMLPQFFAQAAGSTPVSVPANGFTVLPAGDYGAVSVGKDGVLVLSGGTYNVASVSLDKDAHMLFAAAGEVRVEGRFASGKDAVVGPEAGSGVAAQELVLYVAGINGADGALDSTPLAAEVGHSNDVDVNFYVPNGTLRLGHSTDAVGAFLARDVLVENQAQVSLDSFFFNRPPVAGDDSATVDEGGTVDVLDSGESSVLANDSDPNGDPLTVTTVPVSGPDHGALTLGADGTFSYTHDGSETTEDSFVYEVCDDGVPQECDTATVSITVVPVNDPPVAEDDSATVRQDETVSVLDSGESSVLANDSDVDSTNLTVNTTPVSGPDHGALTLNADGTFSYTQDGSETTEDSFVYEVCDDGTPQECDTATVFIDIELPFPLTVSTFGLGSGTVTSSPAGIDCGATCTADFFDGTVVTLTATPAGTSVFSGFGGDADCADGVVTMDAAKSCTARFDASSVPVILTVSLAGDGEGTVSSSPAGIDCGTTCTAGFPNPTRVDLTATPAPGSSFVGFSGDADCADGIIRLTADVTCVATFEQQPAQLTVSKTGLGTGTVTSSPAGIDCGATCSATFPGGTGSVTLTATPDAGSVFGGFSGDADCADGVVTPDVDKSCFARFNLESVDATVTVSLTGSGSGQVFSDPSGISCPGTCSADYPVPTQVFLTAVADPGSVFIGFGGDADCEDGTLRVSSSVSCTAEFEAAPSTFTLTILFIGGGDGQVVTNPPDLFCTGDCSGDFEAGSTVGINARPSGGSFGGWGGDCSGSGFSTSVLMDADKTCTVTFTP